MLPDHQLKIHASWANHFKYEHRACSYCPMHAYLLATLLVHVPAAPPFAPLAVALLPLFSSAFRFLAAAFSAKLGGCFT